MLLIFPPVAKPSEPPAGVAKLKAALLSHGVPCTVLDGNIEGLLYLLRQPVAASDTWTRRARKNLPQHLAELRYPGTYRSRDRYARAVRDVNRILALAGRAHDAVVGLAEALTEDFINFPRSLKGPEVALLFREVGPKKYRVSFRSRRKIDVSLVSRVFQCGGHPNAAGCTVAGSLREVRAKVLKQVRAAF